MPQERSTFGSTIPHPRISTHPVPLQKAHPLPPQRSRLYVHLGRRLCKGEVRGTQANLCLRPEHLFRKIEKHLFKVGKRHVFVNIQPFNLMEEAMRTRRDSLVAINPARTQCESAAESSPLRGSEPTRCGCEVAHPPDCEK